MPDKYQLPHEAHGGTGGLEFEPGCSERLCQGKGQTIRKDDIAARELWFSAMNYVSVCIYIKYPHN